MAPGCSNVQIHKPTLPDTSNSFEILEQTVIKQKRLNRKKKCDLRVRLLLKRTFDLVCEIMDRENGFDEEFLIPNEKLNKCSIVDLNNNNVKCESVNDSIKLSSIPLPCDPIIGNDQLPLGIITTQITNDTNLNQVEFYDKQCNVFDQNLNNYRNENKIPQNNENKKLKRKFEPNSELGSIKKFKMAAVEC